MEAFERYKRHEKLVEESLRDQRVSSSVLPGLPAWLQKLSKKNGLSEKAKSVYLLHGTSMANLTLIVQEGLKTKFSLKKNPSYGMGLYFTDNACKANQYSPDNIILVCRVVLGRTERLRQPCPRKLFPALDCDSAVAEKDYTRAPHGRCQLHNEFIIFNDAACYPEFVIQYSLD